MISDEIKERIKKIKDTKINNHINNLNIFHTFYNRYTPQTYKRPNSTAVMKNVNELNEKMFFTRLRNKNIQIYKNDQRAYSIQTNYENFNPYVTMMMSNGAANATQYQKSKYIQSDKAIFPKNKPKKTKKYFGIDSKTRLDNFQNRNTNYFNSTLWGTKTMSNIPTKLTTTETNILEPFVSDEDRNLANEVFLDAFKKKVQRKSTKEERQYFYTEYNINKKLTKNEISDINKVMNQNNSNNVVFKSIFANEEDKTGINTRVTIRDYKDPFNSFKKLKINSQMTNLIDKMNLNLQYEEYQKKYDNFCELIMQKNRMPNIKILTKKKKKKLKELQNSKYLKFLETPDQETKSKSRKKKSKNNIEIPNNVQNLPYNDTLHLTRTDKLHDLKIKIDYAFFIFHPELRSLFAICFNDDTGDIYLHGGIGGIKYADLWVFKMLSQKPGWKKIYYPTKSEKEPQPRFGHTIHCYQNKIYLIGGEYEKWQENDVGEGIMSIYDFNTNTWDMLKSDYDYTNFKKTHEKKKSSKELNEILPYKDNKKNSILKNINENKKQEKKIRRYSIKSKKLDFKQDINKNDKKLLLTKQIIDKKKNENLNEEEISDTSLLPLFPSLRRNHVSLLIGNNLFIYGGINQEKNYLGDCWIYDFEKQEWKMLEFTGRYPPPLAHHCACLALETTQLFNDTLNVYHKPISERKTLPLLKLDGVFFFGGNNENRIPTNLFFRMSIGIKPAVFDIPHTDGMPPSPRIEASMNFAKNINMVIIHGGRNEIKNEIYNDIVLLDLESLDWVHPKFEGDSPLERSEHKSLTVADKMFIFGGTNGETLLNYDFTIVNLDFFGKINNYN